MLRLTAILYLLSIANAINFENDRREIFVLPNVSVDLAPFTLIGSPLDNFSEFLTLNIECSQKLDEYIKIEKNMINFCNGLDFRGKLSDVNAYFSSLSISLVDYPADAQTITYRLINSSGSEIHSVKQVLTFVRKLSLKNVNDVYEYSQQTNGKSEAMSAVDLAPFINNFDPKFEAVFESVPLFLQSYFVGNTLYFKVQSDHLIIEISGLRYHILERKTGLKSDELYFKVVTVNSQEVIDKADRDSKTEKARSSFLRFLFLFIVGIGLFYYFCVYRKTVDDQRRTVQTQVQVLPRRENLQVSTPNSFEIKGDVLSDSVITWNKDLMAKKGERKAKGVEGNVLVGEKDLGDDHSEINQNYNKPPVGGHFDDISVIDRTDAQQRGGVEGHSAFLDGFNI